MRELTNLRLLCLGLFAVLYSFVHIQSFAATPFKRSLNQKNNSYMKDGIVTGGLANEGTSFLAARRALSNKTGLERFILEMGDENAQASGKKPGYYQVHLDRKNNRLVIDLSQVRYSRVTEMQLRNLLKKSPFVREVSYTVDPEDRSATIVLDLKKPVELEVFELAKKRKAARIVLDLRSPVS